MRKGEISRFEHFFSFFHSVFKRFVLQTGKNKGLFGKRLMLNKQVEVGEVA